MDILMQTTLWDKVSNFDSIVCKLVSGCMSEGMTGFMGIISFIGSGWILSLISILVLLVSLRHKEVLTQGCLIAANLAGVSLVNNLIKIVIQRPRPEILRLTEVGGYSFPSWHAMTAIAYFGFIMYLLAKYLKHWTRYLSAGILGLLILAIGISRIYLGVHYASDVLAGFIMGLVWLALFIRLSNKFLIGQKA